ncbi:MAG: energy transducer TonB [Candidatus Latescibacteria bacterium]|nr:energy transducer TonB [Candidatus Latescibacterota bacterium]
MKPSTVGFKTPEADLHRKSPGFFMLCSFASVVFTVIMLYIPLPKHESNSENIKIDPVIIHLENIPETHHQVRAPAPILSIPLEVDDEMMPDDITIESTNLFLDAAVKTPSPMIEVDEPEIEVAEEEEEIFDVFAVEEEPEIVHAVVPEYPKEARDSHVQGTVFVKVLVNIKGDVDSLSIVKGPTVFHKSSLSAASAVKFKPAKINDRPVSCWVIIPFRFEYKD